MKKKILEYILNICVIIIAYKLSPKDHSAWEFTTWFFVLVFGLWSAFHAWLRQFLDASVLVFAQEDLEDGLYVAKYSPFINQNGLVLKLTRVNRRPRSYDATLFAAERTYYIHTYDPDISEKMKTPGAFTVKMEKGKLVSGE